MKQTVHIGHRAIALRVVALYFLVATVWIVGSDLAVLLWLPESAAAIVSSIAKGMLFVLVTSFALYVVLHRVARMESQPVPHADTTGSPGKIGSRVMGPFFALALALICGTVFIFVHDAREHRKTARDELESRAEFKARDLAAWLGQESQNALSLRHALFFQDDLAALLGGDGAARDRLEKRLEFTRKAFDAAQKLLFARVFGSSNRVMRSDPCKTRNRLRHVPTYVA